jgi:hypothetical protein
MTVKAIYAVSDFSVNGSNVTAAVNGQVVGGSHFDGDFVIDPESPSLNTDLNEAVKTYLATSLSVTFNTGDSVRLFPAIL